MKLFPRKHKHRGPAVSVSSYGYDTRVLRRCSTCGNAFVNVLRGNWKLQQINEAESHETDGTEKDL